MIGEPVGGILTYDASKKARGQIMEQVSYALKAYTVEQLSSSVREQAAVLLGLPLSRVVGAKSSWNQQT